MTLEADAVELVEGITASATLKYKWTPLLRFNSLNCNSQCFFNLTTVNCLMKINVQRRDISAACI